MKQNDEICLCFHVTRRSLEKFVRLEKPVRSSQMSQCFGAGTGCGWCRPILEKIFESGKSGLSSNELDSLEPSEYARQRGEYRQRKKP